MSAPPSKLAVEIAHSVLAVHGYAQKENVELAAAEIDAKIRPLVEDGARLESRFQCWLAMVLAKENCINTVLDILEELKEASESATYLRESVDRECNKAVDAAIDKARAQRPAQEGSDKT